MVVNWRWPCRTAALALVVCWQVPAHVMHGPRAVKKRYTGETGIAINWRDAPSQIQPSSCWKECSSCSNNRSCTRFGWWGFTRRPSAQHGSSHQKPCLQAAFWELRWWDCGCGGRHAANWSCSGGINDAALQFLDVTRDGGPHAKHDPRYCHSECAGGLLKQAVTNVLKVHNPPQERLYNACPRLHAECVCSATVCRPRSPAACATCLGALAPDLSHSLNETVLLHGTSCKVADTYSTVRLRRSDLWWSLRVGRLLQSPWLLWNTWFLGMRTLIVSRVFWGGFSIHPAGGWTSKGRPRYQEAQRVFCTAPLSRTRVVLEACRSCRTGRWWSMKIWRPCPCTLSVTDCQVSFQIQIQKGRTVDRVIERTSAEVTFWSRPPALCEHMRHAQSAQRRSRRLQQDPAACRPNQKCNNNSEQKCERVEAHMCDILCACLRHEAALLQALRAFNRLRLGVVEGAHGNSWHAFRLVFGYHVMCADSCCALGSL